jgi:hypothetical protein
MKKSTRLLLIFLVLLVVVPAFPQAGSDQDVRPNDSRISQGSAVNSNQVRTNSNIQANSALPLRRLALFSSGVGFYEHSGRISGTAAAPFEINLPFSLNAINDALKSLTINDPVSEAPTVRYASSDTLYQTLKSLSVDLSGNPGVADILGSMRGTEVEISAPSPIRGRIIGVENRRGPTGPTGEWSFESWLSLFTPQGIRSIAIRDMASFSFTDEKINADLGRALDLLMNSKDWETRNLLVSLPGEGSRDVSLSYVIPVPVWKVSYRLDLGASEPFLQGWAIVDNDSDTDWIDVELSLVTGRPVSFIQNLYPPYRTVRPVLPLAIAGIADSRTYESGYGGAKAEADMVMRAPGAPVPAPAASDQAQRSRVFSTDTNESMAMMAEQSVTSAASVAGGTVQTAAASVAGDHFEFTLKQPVTLERHQSAMLPLVESLIKAEKALVFSGSQAGIGRTINPAISVELTNTSGMRLPAGPITVYDGGTYAGDALIEFFPENEKRLISYAEDLSVSGSVNSASSRIVTAVTVSGGVMTISRRQDYERVYSIRNASTTAKNLIIEHPITQGTSLGEPAAFDERTPSLYRFRLPLPANQETKFTVREEMPIAERITLSTLRPESLLSYTTNQEIPANVRTALTRAVELRRKIDEATLAQQNLENQRSRFVTEQDRIRRNLEAAGNQSVQGQEYLRRLVAIDGDIDTLNAGIEEAVKNVQAARQEYDSYIANLDLR